MNRRPSILSWMVMAAVLVISFTAVSVDLHGQRNDTDKLVKEAKFLCSTTSILDRVLVNAADQIAENFDNGTYNRLERRGIITVSNVQAAQATLDAYRAAHARLRRDDICRAVPRR